VLTRPCWRRSRILPGVMGAPTVPAAPDCTRGRTRHRRHRPARSTAPRTPPGGGPRGPADVTSRHGARRCPGRPGDGARPADGARGGRARGACRQRPARRPVERRRRRYPAPGGGGGPWPAAAPGLRLDRGGRPHPVRLLPRQVRRRAGAARLGTAGDPAAGHAVPRLRRRPARHRPARAGPPGADGLAGAAGRRRRGRGPRGRGVRRSARRRRGGVQRPAGPVGRRPRPRLGGGPRAGRARRGHPGTRQAERGLPGRRRAGPADDAPTPSTWPADRRSPAIDRSGTDGLGAAAVSRRNLSAGPPRVRS
jgi:hypothetical protein